MWWRFKFPVGRFCFACLLCYFSALARLMVIVTVDIGGCVKPTDSSLIGLYGMSYQYCARRSHSSSDTLSSRSALFQ